MMAGWARQTDRSLSWLPSRLAWTVLADVPNSDVFLFLLTLRSLRLTPPDPRGCGRLEIARKRSEI